MIGLSLFLLTSAGLGLGYMMYRRRRARLSRRPPGEDHPKHCSVCGDDSFIPEYAPSGAMYYRCGGCDFVGGPGAKEILDILADEDFQALGLVAQWNQLLGAWLDIRETEAEIQSLKGAIAETAASDPKSKLMNRPDLEGFLAAARHHLENQNLQFDRFCLLGTERMQTVFRKDIEGAHFFTGLENNADGSPFWTDDLIADNRRINAALSHYEPTIKRLEAKAQIGLFERWIKAGLKHRFDDIVSLAQLGSQSSILSTVLASQLPTAERVSLAHIIAEQVQTTHLAQAAVKTLVDEGGLEGHEVLRRIWARVARRHINHPMTVALKPYALELNLPAPASRTTAPPEHLPVQEQPEK